MNLKLQINQILNNKELLVLIIVGIIIQSVLLKYKYNKVNLKLTERIEFNLSNESLIEKTISSDLERRLSLLKTSTDTNTSSKLNYKDWIDMNNNSDLISFGSENKNIDYFIQVWRSIPNTNNEKFVLKVYPDKNWVDHTYDDFLKYINTIHITSNDDIDKDLIKMFFLDGMEPYSVFKIIWYDSNFNQVVERKEIVYRYDDGFGNKGTISSGFTIRNIEEEYTYDHYKRKEMKNLYYSSILFTIVFTLMIYLFNIDIPKVAMIKASLFYIIFMSYITYYMTIEDEEGSVEIELKKFENINQGILSMSFMTGLSIFILNKLKEKENFLYKETTFLLIVYMIAIIAILFKNNAYVKTEDVTAHRVFKEFIFNYCILINMFIIINFGIDVFLSSKTK